VSAPTPGNFSVVVKGILSNGKHFVKLAMYNFQPNGSIREDFWHWDYDKGDSYDNQLSIGSLPSPIPYYQCKDDEDRYVIGMNRFHRENFTTLYGRWIRSNRNVYIDFNQDNQEERWYISWEENANNNPSNILYKIELVGASYVLHRDRFYLQSDLSRLTDPVPLNV
jgi:hypothetical protein